MHSFEFKIQQYLLVISITAQLLLVQICTYINLNR